MRFAYLKEKESIITPSGEWENQSVDCLNQPESGSGNGMGDCRCLTTAAPEGAFLQVTA
jgi:hypothetical protein